MDRFVGESGEKLTNEERLIGIAGVLREFRALPVSTDEQREDILTRTVSSLRYWNSDGPIPASDSPSPNVDRYLQSVNFYFPASTSSSTPVSILNSTPFILHPRPTDTESQALCRKTHHSAFLRGKMGTVVLRLLKYGLSSPAYSYERMDAVSISIECRPIRMWIYGVIQGGLGFEPVMATYQSQPVEEEVIEIVRDGETTVQSLVEIVSLPTLIKLNQISFALDTSIPTVLQSIEYRTEFVQRIFRIPPTFDFRLDKI